MAYSFVDGGYGNLEAPWMIPEAMRERHLLNIRLYDWKFSPVLQEIFPKTPAPDGGANKFDWPIMVNPEPMAMLFQQDEEAPVLNAGGIGLESFSTRISKSAFQRRSDEFRRDFKDNLISLKYQILAEMIMESVNRRVEFELANYLYGNTYAIGQFSEQASNLGRFLVADLETGQFLDYAGAKVRDNLLSGSRWDAHTTADPLRDIATIQRMHEDMMGSSLTKGFIGPETAMWLSLNEKVIEQLKYIRDTTDGILGTALHGINITKVIGQTYKEVPSAANAGVLGYPGLGDVDIDKWTDRNKVEIMVDGSPSAGCREWGIFSEDTVGRTFYGFLHTEHEAQSRGDPTRPFTWTWREQDPFKVKTRVGIAFCPAVEDFAKYILVKNMCLRP